MGLVGKVELETSAWNVSTRSSTRNQEEEKQEKLESLLERARKLEEQLKISDLEGFEKGVGDELEYDEKLEDIVPDISKEVREELEKIAEVEKQVAELLRPTHIGLSQSP